MAIACPSATFTRPNDTTAYASGDLVANSTTAGSVTAMSWVITGNVRGNVSIRRARIVKSTTGATSPNFRLHLYSASPLPPTNGDNGAWVSPGYTNNTYLGNIDLNADKVFTDGAGGAGAPASGQGTEINITGGVDMTIYGLLEARGAYAPGAQEVFVITLEVVISQ